MDDEQRIRLIQSSDLFPPQTTKQSYGTAGFRSDASLLDSTVFRMGILSVLRSLKTQSTIGLMITASHNKVSDNGIKIADPSGGMLSQDWEPFAESLANAPSSKHLLQVIEELTKKENISFHNHPTMEVLIGRDTRPSGKALLEAAKQGIESIAGAVAHDLGILSTPQLHWMVRARNKGVGASESDYFHQLSTSFRDLMDLNPKNRDVDEVIVDGANGVGGDKLNALRPFLQGLKIQIRNTGDTGGVLNEGVGADFVQKEKTPPNGFGPNDAGLRCASLDGDGDRLVYFTPSRNAAQGIILVDGDKILSLFALFLKDQLEFLSSEGDPISFGAVQTAYANGASTSHLRKSGVEVVLTPTGVKHLHKEAERYDVGIYFEANGHGTVLFSDALLVRLETRTGGSPDERNAALRLLAVSKLMNQAVGDALSGLLLVEAVLKYYGWDFDTWNGLYDDLPSRQLKVKVRDRTVVVTSTDETTVVAPRGIQEMIDAEIGKYSGGRCFIRPSGTEDVIRVYAEAVSEDDAQKLAHSVAQLVQQRLGS